MRSLLVFITFLILSSASLVNAELERVSDDELEKLISNEKFVITLFRTKECGECDDLESLLLSIREDLVDALNGWVVAAESSSLALNFTSGGSADAPKIVFFRQSIPMLYDGPLSEELLLETLTQSQEVAVHNLNDETFEHLTQAASGATTGDWFVMFYRDDCEACMKFHAKWEYIGSQLKGRINLATVNIMLDGISTGRRFQVESVPTFLFFHQQKYYHYDIPNMDSKAFQNFALGWYKNAQSTVVPAPQTPFDELVDRTVFLLKENPMILPVSGVLLLLTVVAIIVNAIRSREKPKKKTVTKKKDSKKTK